MSLLAEFLHIAQDWRSVFPQQRTFERALRQSLGSLVCLGRRCLSRIIWTNGGQHRVGQAQLWNATAVPKQPVLAVAAYSALLLASLKAFGAERGSAYAELPKWRRNARRPSCLDLITLLRKEMTQQSELLDPLGLKIGDSQLVRAAAA